MAKKQYTPEEYKAKLDKKAEKNKRFASTFTKVFAFCLAIAMVYSASVIAFTRTGTANLAPTASTPVGGSQVSNDPVNSNDPATGNDDSVQEPSNDVGNDDPAAPSDNGDNTDNSGNSGTANSGTSSNKGDSTTKPAQSNTDKTQQAIDLYKKGISNAKSSAKKVVHTKTGATNYNGIVEAGGLSSAASTLMGMFMKSSEPNEEIDKNELPPVAGSNKLTKATVQSVNIKEDANTYTVSIKMKDAVNPVAGADGIGSVANIIEDSQITESVKSVPGLSVSNIQLAYENVYITCKIDKATGNMTYLFVDAPCILSLDAKLLVTSLSGAKIGIESKDEYTIAY